MMLSVLKLLMTSLLYHESACFSHLVVTEGFVRSRNSDGKTYGTPLVVSMVDKKLAADPIPLSLRY
jgi:hypothetical protein